MKPAPPAAPANETLTLAWRIGLPRWEPDAEWARLLSLLTEHRAVVDEVALFDTITHHLYIPLDAYGPRMELAARRLAAFRKAGVPSAGINVLCTLGHVNEAWSTMAPLPFQPMVGHNGDVSKGCACPNTPELRAYVQAKYTLAAQAEPDFIWVDDDIRLQNHGVAWGCFCPTCLALFARKAGRAYPREELVKAFDDPAGAPLRRLWVEQNTDSIESLLAGIGAAIRAVNPAIKTGLMTAGAGWTTYSGQAFKRWFTALGATKSRPGGGFYCDYSPLGMVNKTLECGLQRAPLPPAVTDVQYELENFPYQLMQKSATALITECTLALAQGLNGIAFNLFAMPTSEEDYRPRIERLPAVRPLWEQWVAHSAGLPTAGLWPAWSRHLMARRSVRQGDSWLNFHRDFDINRQKVLQEIGIPLAADAPGCGTVLSGRIAEAFSDDELKGFLSRGVLMDSTTLDVLAERGLDHLAGVRVARRLDNGLMERFTDDELNGAAAGKPRDARIEFWGDATGMGDVLEPVAPGVRILTIMEDYFYRPQGPAMTAYENELGGRVVVAGYAPWIFLQSVSKRLQLQNVADWISRGAMPVRTDEPVPLIPVARVSPDGRRASVLLLNAGLDAIPEATVHLRLAARRARLLEIGRPDRVLELEPEQGGCRLTLENVPPWSMRLLLLGA